MLCCLRAKNRNGFSSDCAFHAKLVALLNQLLRRAARFVLHSVMTTESRASCAKQACRNWLMNACAAAKISCSALDAADPLLERPTRSESTRAPRTLPAASSTDSTSRQQAGAAVAPATYFIISPPHLPPQQRRSVPPSPCVSSSCTITATGTTTPPGRYYRRYQRMGSRGKRLRFSRLTASVYSS